MGAFKISLLYEYIGTFCIKMKLMPYDAVFSLKSIEVRVIFLSVLLIVINYVVFSFLKQNIL